VRRDDVSVVDIAFHRSVAVTVGVLWAAFVSRFWWPAEARRELSKALGESVHSLVSGDRGLTVCVCRFCLNVGWLYTRLVASNSFSSEAPLEEEAEADPTEESSLIPRRPKTVLNNSIEEFMAMCVIVGRSMDV